VQIKMAVSHGAVRERRHSKQEREGEPPGEVYGDQETRPVRAATGRNKVNTNAQLHPAVATQRLSFSFLGRDASVANSASVRLNMPFAYRPPLTHMYDQRSPGCSSVHAVCLVNCWYGWVGSSPQILRLPLAPRVF
jgi:hypothetical protein